ncbi:hypothetical protein H8D36_01935 [archaeon]|nr:hypothetical protein [archaeon]MBL7057547.1 hypothetical protein [Candidatus Woesearchaeota archaeon]
MRKIAWTLVTKIGLATVIVGTYVYHKELKKIDYNLFNKKQEIAYNFYKNPPILDVEWRVNNNGLIETYLVNKETGKKVEVMYDMLPKSETMIQGLRQRYPNSYKELGEIEEILEQKEEQSVNMLERMLGYFNN